jgi:DNA-binding IclR family transcriptional regulator
MTVGDCKPKFTLACRKQTIFGQRLGDPTADRILEALRNAGPKGLTDNDIYELFGRNKAATERTRALHMLVELGLVHTAKEPYSDTYMNVLSNTRVYGRVKNRFPLLLATANPRFYM